MPRRPFQMQPLGPMMGVFRPKRVSSSTCPMPTKNPQAAAWVDDQGAGFDPSLGLTHQEAHVVQIGDSNEDLAADAASYLGL